MSVKGFTFGSDTTIQKYDYDSLDNLPDLDTKASIDGTYPSLAVGSLLGNSVEDKVPYLFRPTGGGLSVGDREYDTLVGGTVVWNQLIADANRDFTNTTTDTRPTGFELWIGGGTNASEAYRKIITSSGLFGCVFNSPTATEIIRVMHFGSARDIIFFRTESRGLEVNHKYMFTANFQSIDYTTEGGLVVKNINLIDLTALFGSTIADYVYSLEQATAGAGVAFFRKLFPNDYYAYNAGELMSVSALQSHEMVGFNLFDKATSMTFDRYLQTVSNTEWSWAASSDSKSVAVRCLPNTQYWLHINGLIPNIFRAGAITKEELPTGLEPVPLEKIFVNSTTGGMFYTTGQNAKWLIVQISSAMFDDARDNLCINISDPSRNGTYEPYVKHSYPLDSTLTLRGIPKLADGKLYYDGDVYAHDGTVARKYGVVDLGTLDWFFHKETAHIFRCVPPNMKTVIEPPYENRETGVICSAYSSSNNYTISESMDDKSWLRTGAQFFIRDTSYNNISEFKTAMSGVMLVYELATPTTEAAEPYEHAQICDPNGTEQYVTDSIVPVGHSTEYPENLATKIASLPALPTTAGEYKLKVTVVSGKASYEWVTG